MDILTTAVFGIVFFMLIMVSVALHEVGHLVPAKIFGVRVPQYFVGFGPSIFSLRRGETEYGMKWFPLGGYVRLLGMYPPARERSGKSAWAVRFQAWTDDARSVEWSEITERDQTDGRLFYQKKTWQKLVVMFGGPCMNLLIAFVLFWGIVGLYGSYQVTTQVQSVQPCVTSGNATACTASDPLSPAAQAGLLAGDRVVAFNGVQIESQPQLAQLIRANMDSEARITVSRDGQLVELAPTRTLVLERPSTADPKVTQPVGYLGYTAAQERVKGGPGDALAQMWEMTKMSYVALANLPVSVWNVTAGMVTGAERPVDSPISIVGASVVAGEVAAADNVDVGAKVVMFASLLGSLNLFLALLNLLPLPPLDGGHIAGACYEWLKRQGARLLRRPRPAPFDAAKLLPVTYLVAGFMLVCGLALIVADIVSPVKLF
jgi:membrane-associated protease RseP (regulator of RpoE activity)